MWTGVLGLGGGRITPPPPTCLAASYMQLQPGPQRSPNVRDSRMEPQLTLLDMPSDVKAFGLLWCR